MTKKKPKKTKRQVKAEELAIMLRKNSIDLLPEFHLEILEERKHCNKTLELLRSCRPGNLDRSLINRMKKANMESMEISVRHRTQLSVWREKDILPEQEKLITECETILDDIDILLREIDKLTVSQISIDEIMEMSDEEVAIKALCGELGDLI